MKHFPSDDFIQFFFSFQDIQSIRGLLRRRELSTSSVRKVCSGSTNLTAMNLISVFAIVIIALSNFRKF